MLARPVVVRTASHPHPRPGDQAALSSRRPAATDRQRCPFTTARSNSASWRSKSVTHSLKILHDPRIVHGDLKPSNILVKRTELGYTTKLIDFDSSYIAGKPPSAAEIVGTINYYSPELLGYVQNAGVHPSELGVASDVFAIGLIYSGYLTGALPPFDAPRYHEPAVAFQLTAFETRAAAPIPAKSPPGQVPYAAEACEPPPPSQASPRSHPPAGWSGSCWANWAPSPPHERRLAVPRLRRRQPRRTGLLNLRRGSLPRRASTGGSPDGRAEHPPTHRAGIPQPQPS